MIIKPQAWKKCKERDYYESELEVRELFLEKVRRDIRELNSSLLIKTWYPWSFILRDGEFQEFCSQTIHYNASTFPDLFYKSRLISDKGRIYLTAEDTTKKIPTLKADMTHLNLSQGLIPDDESEYLKKRILREEGYLSKEYEYSYPVGSDFKRLMKDEINPNHGFKFVLNPSGGWVVKLPVIEVYPKI